MIKSMTFKFNDFSNHVQQFEIARKIKEIIPVDNRTVVFPGNDQITVHFEFNSTISSNLTQTVLLIWVNPDNDPSIVDEKWVRLTPAHYDSSPTHNSYWAKIG